MAAGGGAIGRTGRLATYAAAGLLLCLCADAADAADADKARRDLRAVERERQVQQRESEQLKARAEQLKAELDGVTAELIQAAKRVQDQEAAIAGLEAELARLEREANEKEARLKERRRQFSGVMMALSRIARFPTEAMIAQPIPPEDTVQSAILLRAAVPAIERRASSLRLDLEDLSFARERVEGQRAQLRDAVAGLQEQHRAIETVRQQKAALRAEALSKSRAAESRVRELSSEAENLRDLVESLNKAHREAQERAREEAERRRAQDLAARPPEAAAPAEPTPEVAPDMAALGSVKSITKARGRLPFPAVGRLVGVYGQRLDAGLTSKGLSIETRASAWVIAPFDGNVVFAGPFRGYGQLLIIDHGEGYHSLLAGLGRIDTAIGQPVLAGEPVAVMDGGADQPVLYVEFRRNNQPINPLPWLAERKGTPKG
ncbi:MAG: peptidoglycan DD-metalloendopeptidase family protein [Alphaproteobacteria bacterium]|nr:peptidoglycan DD-metalloendopeptidase family protein [Alphaproteobacteria bacterium]MBF0251906.1 peptidoglycan DD-metalloendopeptidase family protein [Alphaproteobacteria bacterium]